MGFASEFCSWGGNDSAKDQRNSFSPPTSQAGRNTGIYKTLNYKALEDQVRKRLRDVRSVLDKAELIPQSTARNVLHNNKTCRQRAPICLPVSADFGSSSHSESCLCR